MTQGASQEKLLYTEGRLGDLMKPVPRERRAQGAMPLPGQRRASRERQRVDPLRTSRGWGRRREWVSPLHRSGQASSSPRLPFPTPSNPLIMQMKGLHRFV